MIDNNIQQQFIQEALDFFAKNNIETIFRDNKDGVCKFISPETKSIIIYEEELDLSINIGFEKTINISIEHRNTNRYVMDYNMNIFSWKLSMVFETIELYRKIRSVHRELHSSEVNMKWKTKKILEKLNAEEKISDGV